MVRIYNYIIFYGRYTLNFYFIRKIKPIWSYELHMIILKYSFI